MKWRLCLLAVLFLAFGAKGAAAQERAIRGTVTDDVSGAPVSFPQIAVQGTTIGTVGGEDGTFTLRGVPPGEVTLVIQRIGYQTRRVTVPADQATVEVTLVTDYLQVEELVVTGRATAVQRRVLPNAVETISGEQVNELPQQTIDQALQGRVTGAVIARNSGAPGGGLQLNIRGSSSINAAAEPLYVVDGTIVSNIAIASGQNELTNALSGSTASQSLDQDVLQNRIADLNMEDIANIEVLKGASAAAIYGSKASNGVVIITTKRGQAGRTQVRGSFQGGFFDLSNKLDQRVFQSEEEAVAVFGETASEFYEGQAYDNQEALAGRNDFSWQASGNVSGGAEGGLQYFGSGLWKNDEGIIKNTGFEKQSARLNLSTEVGDRATVDLNTNVIHSVAGRSITNNGNEETASHWMVFSFTPTFIDLRRRPDGSFPVNPFTTGGTNPLQTAEFLENAESVWRAITSVNLDVDLIDGDKHNLSIIAPVGVDFFTQENRIFSPPILHYESFDGNLGTVVLGKADNVNLNAGVNGVWEHRPSDAIRFTTSVGAQFERRDTELSRQFGQNLIGGKDKVDAATVVQIVEQQVEVEDFGFYVQEEVLALDERLLLTGMVRFDQSSTAGDPEKLFIYPKAAASYRLVEPGGFFDDVKFRAAFGQTGNQPLCDLALGCQKFTSLTSDQNIDGLPGITIENTIGDPELEPERMSEFEGGVDLSLLNGRGTLELTGYVQIIKNLILQREIAESTGFDDLFFNGGKLRNTGFEASLGLTPVRGSDLTWVSRTSFFLNRSKLLDLPVPAFRTSSGFGLDLGQGFIMEGQSITQLAGLDPDCTGLDEPFDYCLQEDLANLGDTNPDFAMSFSNDFSFGHFRLFSLFEWRQGQDVVNLTELLGDLIAGGNMADTPVGWSFPGGLGNFDERDIEECHPDCNAAERVLGFVNGYARPFVQPASFLKAREISLSYELPEGTVSGLFGGFFDQIRLRASARDLFTITNYRGLDPEVSNFGNQQVGRSIDVAPFPPSRSFWLGVDVGL